MYDIHSLTALTSLRPLRRGPVPAMLLEPLQQRRVERLAVADGDVRLDVLELPHPGMIVETVGSARIQRSASSGIVIPAGTSGRRASARSTLASRFSGTK